MLHLKGVVMIVAVDDMEGVDGVHHKGRITRLATYHPHPLMVILINACRWQANLHKSMQS